MALLEAGGPPCWDVARTALAAAFCSTSCCSDAPATNGAHSEDNQADADVSDMDTVEGGRQEVAGHAAAQDVSCCGVVGLSQEADGLIRRVQRVYLLNEAQDLSR